MRIFIAKKSKFNGLAGFCKGLTGATLFLGLLLNGCASVSAPFQSQRPELPRIAPRELTPIGRIDFSPINESSGLVQSIGYPRVFWTHNDSGDAPRLFAIKPDGQLVLPENVPDYKGITVEGAKNRDWEGIAVGPNGELLIGDFGNNANKRRDLVIYVVSEPDPYEDVTAELMQRIFFYYPEQVEFPPEANNFDCEAFFYWEDSLYFITKHRADFEATLYRLDYPQKASTQPLPLECLAQYKLRGQVTAADAYKSRIAVLTYNGVWVFEPEPLERLDLYSGHIWWQPIRARQCEAIAFLDDSTVLLTNEQRDIYELRLSEMQKVK